MLDDALRFLFQNGVHAKMIIVFLFVGLEHLMDVAFVCPCDPKWNTWVSSGYFVLPSFIIFLLMIVAQWSLGQSETGSPSDEADERTPLLRDDSNSTVNDSEAHAGRRRRTEEGSWRKTGRRCLIAMVAPVLWVTLMFFEGQFYVCAMTDWSGRFVKLNDTYEHMWCRPDRFPITDQMKRSNDFYITSQWIALGLLLVTAFCVFVYTLWICCKSQRN